MAANNSIGNISLLDPGYNGIDWVRDNFLVITNGDGATWILFGLFIGLFIVFVTPRNSNKYISATISGFGSFVVGMLFWFWGLLPQGQEFVLFILFMIFFFGAVGLGLKIRDERQSLQN